MHWYHKTQQTCKSGDVRTNNNIEMAINMKVFGFHKVCDAVFRFISPWAKKKNYTVILYWSAKQLLPIFLKTAGQVFCRKIGVSNIQYYAKKLYVLNSTAREVISTIGVPIWLLRPLNNSMKNHWTGTKFKLDLHFPIH